MHLYEFCAHGGEKCFKLARSMRTIPVSFLLTACKMEGNVKENGGRGTVFCHGGAVYHRVLSNERVSNEVLLFCHSGAVYHRVLSNDRVSNAVLLVDSPSAVYSSHRVLRIGTSQHLTVQ
jgi:hypothetical protein